MQGQHLITSIARGPVNPGNSIIWKMIQALLVKVNDGAAHRCHGQYEQ
jgi:hypothetical protein